MRTTSTSLFLTALPLAAILIALAAPAVARDEKEGDEPQILLSADLPTLETEHPFDTVRRFSHLFELDDDWGLRFTQKMKFGERRVYFSVLGPVYRGKSAGLGFKLKF